MRESSDKPRFGNILQDTWAVFLEAVKVMKNKEGPRNCHRPEETKEIRQLNAMWYSSLGPGQKRTLMEEQVKFK